jgi:hypothetical protein
MTAGSDWTAGTDPERRADSLAEAMAALHTQVELLLASPKVPVQTALDELEKPGGLIFEPTAAQQDMERRIRVAPDQILAETSPRH